MRISDWSSDVCSSDLHQRRVELAEGEALFRVEHDAGRPFTVEAGNGRVTVTGTRFDVRRDADSTRVAVEQGSVKVQGRDATQEIGRASGRERVSPYV